VAAMSLPKTAFHFSNEKNGGSNLPLPAGFCNNFQQAAD
jgi:hypothetical protein